jgi:hypothetical protein
MKDHSALTLEWVCGEGTPAAFAARVGTDGGTVTATTAFVPEPEEADLYSDAQFEPLVVVGVALTTGLVMRYLRELILDLKGREIAVVDLTGETPQVRIVPVGKASLVLVKAADGSVTKFAPSEIDKLEQSLAGLLRR